MAAEFLRSQVREAVNEPEYTWCGLRRKLLELLY
jgi:hypothetical protein